MLKCIFAGMSIGFEAFLKVLPIFNQLNDIKEQLIANLFGTPVVIISFIFFVPTAIRVIRKLFIIVQT